MLNLCKFYYNKPDQYDVRKRNSVENFLFIKILSYITILKLNIFIEINSKS
jgi:hypothetical protein